MSSTLSEKAQATPSTPPKNSPPASIASQNPSIGPGTKDEASTGDDDRAAKSVEDISPLGPPGTKEEDVEELSAMFPIIDVGVIEAVLNSAGSKDQAAEQLLGMTDPSFTPTPSERELQTSLDADFAQALHIQDRDRNAGRFPPPPTAPPYRGSYLSGRREGRLRDRLAARLDRPDYPPFDPETYVPPYQPRARKPRAQRHGHGPYDGEYARAMELQASYGDDDVHFNDFEKKVLHMAEQGKQTFNTLFTRAKAKYEEYSHDQMQNPPPGGLVAGAQARIEGLWGPPRK